MRPPRPMRHQARKQVKSFTKRGPDPPGGLVSAPPGAVLRKKRRWPGAYAVDVLVCLWAAFARRLLARAAIFGWTTPLEAARSTALMAAATAAAESRGFAAVA